MAIREESADVAEAIALLGNARSPKRRSGAKRLQKMRVQAAGPALLAALQREMHDARTWETQLEMIRALGQCDYAPALSYLEELARHPFKATMVYWGLGYAIIYLQRNGSGVDDVALGITATANNLLIGGALESLAELGRSVRSDVITSTLAYVSKQPIDLSTEALWYAAALAAAAWGGPESEAFLRRCAAEAPDWINQAVLRAGHRSSR